MTIDSVQIECFVAASKYLNFSRAANSLYISQPVLSRRIARLEQELDVTLFDRTGRTLKLTDAGRKLSDFFVNSAAEFAEILAGIRQTQYVNGQTIRLGVCEGLDLTKYLRSVMNAFKDENSEANIILDSDHVELLIDKFKHEQLDIMIMQRATIDNNVKSGNVSRIQAHDLIDAHYCVIYSDSNPLFGHKKLKIEDFGNQKLYCLKKEHVSQKVLTHASLTEKYGISPQIVLCSTVDSIIMSLQMGDGFMISDDHKRMLNAGGICHFDLEETLPISIVTREDSGKLFSDFISFCLDFNSRT